MTDTTDLKAQGDCEVTQDNGVRAGHSAKPEPASRLGQKASVPDAVNWADARAVAIMYDLHEKYKGGACEPIGHWLVRRAKRTWPRFAGFKFFSRTNVKRSWVLISYHHPAQLCWLWSVWFTLFPRMGRKWVGKGFGQYWMKIPYLFELRLTTQTGYAWMLSQSAHQRLQAIAQHMDEGAEG